MAFCCCWGPAVVDNTSVPGVDIVVSIHSVVALLGGWRPCYFSVHAVVGVSTVVGVLLLLKSLLGKTEKH